MWVIKSSFTKNRLREHEDKNELRRRRHHCHLWSRLEALLQTHYHRMEMETGSVTNSITAIYSKDLKLS